MTHSFDNDLLLRLQGGLRKPLIRSMEAVVIKTGPSSHMTHAPSLLVPCPLPSAWGKCAASCESTGLADKKRERLIKATAWGP